MGIHGLTSYVAKHAERFYEDYKLYNCTVLIDGNSAASLIYSEHTKSNHAFGGDYDQFANSTIEFVRLFKKCHVRPIFIFDGGYELRKLRTVLDRIKSNIMICGQYKNKYRESKTFPLLLRDVFRSILIDLDVTVIQCDFEADHELVILARILRCPIISSDSDFYICDSPYVPFNSVDFRAVRFKKNTASRRYYIPCKRFLIDKFLDHVGGLENKALLPLLSCALGNDYVPKNTFKNFLNLSYSTDFETRIKQIVIWLRNFTSVDDVIEQMVKHVQRDVTSLKRIIKQMTTEYNSKISHLLSYLPKEIFSESKHEDNRKNSHLISPSKSEESNHMNDDSLNGNILVDSDIDDYIPDSENSDEDSVEIEQVEEYDIVISDADSDFKEEDVQAEPEPDPCIVESNQIELDPDILEKRQNNENIVTFNVNLPSWFMQKYRSGSIPPNLMNVINFRRLFIPSQSEDYFSRPSHEISLPLLYKIVGIILGPSFNGIVKCHARIKGIEIGVYEIAPIYEISDFVQLPNLESVESLDQSSRSTLLLACANLPQDMNLNLFPEEWRLYVIALMYWMKNCTSMINSTHIRAIVMCLIQLSIIDRKIGFARSRTDLGKIRKEAKRNSKTTAKETKSTGEANVDETESFFSNHKNFITVEDYLAVISEEDCYRAAISLLQFHGIHENLLKNRKRFNTKLVHVFAQLQHCVLSMTILNAILNFPFVPCQLQRFFSGTFLYNFYVELHNRKLADGFVTRSLLTKSHSVIALYRYIIGSWEAITSVKVVPPKFEIKNKWKKKKNVIKVKIEEENDTADDKYQDPNNFFSLLSIEQ